ncbi:hypothetical protein TrST_g10688 [Triparma strigata]|uniref:Ankyrin repeat protein n=1 Tax=Triparma strigata TaxID=1606541 RepID=A0A9W7BVV6_9STRA|nr:hypothetical protein TrST_g10688 [Triparma strigata]
MWKRLTQLASPSKKRGGKAERRASAPAAASTVTPSQTENCGTSTSRSGLDFGKSSATPPVMSRSATKISPSQSQSALSPIKESPETVQLYISSGNVKALRSFLNSMKSNTRKLDDTKFTLFHVIHTTLVSCCSVGSLPCLNAVLEFLKKNPSNIRLPKNSTPTSVENRPLSVACYSNHASLLPTIIRHTALLNRLYTPLEVVEAKGMSKPSKDDVHVEQRRLSVYSLRSESAEEITTPLHVAAGRGSLDCVKCLVNDFNMNVNVRTSCGETPLHYACCNARPTVVKFLLEKGANPSLCDVDGGNCLHLACETGAKDCVKLILAKCTKNERTRLCRSQTVNGDTPLHAAAFAGCALTSKLLVEGGSGLGNRNRQGDTPILKACTNNSAEGAQTFRVLLECLEVELKSRGAEEDVGRVLDRMINARKRRCIDICARNNSVETLKLLIDRKCDVSAFRFSGGKIRYGDSFPASGGAGRLGSDFEFRSSLNEKASIKQSPLCLAAERGNSATLSLLVQTGADVDERSGDNSETPLMAAVKYGRANTVKFLLRKGAGVWVNNRNNLNLVDHLDIFLNSVRSKNPSLNFSDTVGAEMSGGDWAGSGVSRAASIHGDDDSDDDGEAGEKQTSNSQDRKSARKIKRLLRLSLEGWSMDAHKVWGGHGRRAVDCWLDSRFREEGRSFIPIEVKMHILGFLSRQHWIRVEGVAEVGEGGWDLGNDAAHAGGCQKDDIVWLDSMRAQEDREHKREEEKDIEAVERDVREETEPQGTSTESSSLMMGMHV